MSKPIERIAEDKFATECSRRGFKALKMVIPGWVNWPDRQVLLGHGYTFFIEFKREGKEPTRAQLHRHEDLRAMGYSVYVCCTLAEALEALEKELQLMGVRG